MLRLANEFMHRHSDGLPKSRSCHEKEGVLRHLAQVASDLQIIALNDEPKEVHYFY